MIRSVQPLTPLPQSKVEGGTDYRCYHSKIFFLWTYYTLHIYVQPSLVSVMSSPIGSILVVIAMEAEAAPLIKHLGLAPSSSHDPHCPAHFFTVTQLSNPLLPR
jgi:hypothetical protein